MLRAAPSIMRIAASMSLAFKSFILVCAISRTLARRIVPAVARPGVPLPLSMPAAFLIRSAAGGVLVTKLNERSSKIVISAVLAQRRADGRRGRGFASGQLQGDDGFDLFCHLDLRQFAEPEESQAPPVSLGQRMTQGHALCLFRG